MSVLALGTRGNTVRVIAGREFEQLRRGLGSYIALVVTLLVVSWLVGTDVNALRSSGLLVAEDPFAAPLLSAVLVLAFFLAVSAVVSVARDRERGTLEVLFYGPVDEISYLVGKLTGQVTAYLAALPVVLLGLLALQLLTGFVISGSLVMTLLLSVIPAAEIVVVGLLFSVIGRSVRAAVLLFVSIVILLVGISFAASFVALIPIDGADSPIIPLRDALARLAVVVDWVSPFAHLERTTQHLAAGRTSAAVTTMMMSVAYAGLALALAAVGLAHRGVRRRED